MKRRMKDDVGPTNREAAPGAPTGLPSSFPRARRAYTLTEILIVIGIIVLMLGLAVPALKVITGSRSLEAAENQLSAVLGRARAQAIAERDIAGLMFFWDPNVERVRAAIVHRVDLPRANSPTPGDPYKPTTASFGFPEVYLDLAVDQNGDPVSDFFSFPPGIGVQLLDSCQVDTNVNPPVRRDDGYIGYNGENAWNQANNSRPNVPYGGVILFDGQGRLVSYTYAFRTAVATNTTVTPPTLDWSPMGKLLYPLTSASRLPNNATGSNEAAVMPQGAPVLMPSQFGLVIYDREPFRNQQFTDVPTDPTATKQLSDAQADPANTTSGQVQTAYQSPVSPNPKSELEEEKWLDQNATPLIANRYNGTLVRGE